MSQEAKQGGESSQSPARPQPQVVVHGYAPQHIAPGYEQILCQCGCGAPLQAVGAVHAAAAARQRHQHQQPSPAAAHSHPGQFAAGGQGMMHPHPHMYTTGQFPAQQDMHQLHSQFAAAAAMSQYANYGRGLSELDPYRSPHMSYRPPMEIPAGYVLPGAAGAAAYLASGTHPLNYYSHHYPGMIPVPGGDSRRDQVAPTGATGNPPEPAPPPSKASPSQSPSHPKESILESLLAARSERMSAASVEMEEAAASAAHGGGDGRPAQSSPARGVSTSRTGKDHPDDASKAPETTTGRDQSAAGPKIETIRANTAAGGAGGGHRSPFVTSMQHARPEALAGRGRTSSAATVPSAASGAGAEVATKVAAVTAAATAAATALHLTGLRGRFPADRHGMGGMAPPLSAVTVPPTGGAVLQYIPAAGALPPPPPPQPSSSSSTSGVQSAGFPSHDATEERMRQQEKKLQKRAANRKSAQLSRKRKKALIEELRYENQDLQRHEDILEVIPDPVFAFNTTSGRVWFASPSASAQFGVSVEDLTSACFFDLMTEDCSKRLRVLIDTAAKDVSDTNSALLHERMTVRFKKRKGAILLGELSGRLSRQTDDLTAVCSVRPLSLATDDVVGKGYIGDASVSELAEDTSADQGSSGEESRSAGTGQTSGSNADCSSGLGTGCTSIADEASSSGVPSLSSLEVKRPDGSSSGSTTGSAGSKGSVSTGSTGSSGGLSGSTGSAGSTGGGTGEGSTGSGGKSGGSEEGGAYNSNSDSLPSSGGQEGDDDTIFDSDGGDRRKKRRTSPPSASSTASSLPGRHRSARGGGAASGSRSNGVNNGAMSSSGGHHRGAKSVAEIYRRTDSRAIRGSASATAPDANRDRRPPSLSLNGGAKAARKGGSDPGMSMEVRQWEAAAGLESGLPRGKARSTPKSGRHGGAGENHER